MADAFTDTSAGSWTLIVETAYDRKVDFELRSMPLFRAVIDKHPEQQAMPGDVVVLTLHNDLPVSVTPLVETVDPDAIAAPPPTRVTITLEEYGTPTIQTIRLRKLAFTSPEMELVELIARNQADTIDLLVKNKLDTGTNVLRRISGTLTAPGARTGVTSTDVFNDSVARAARTIMARNKAMPKLGDRFLAYAHPDVVHDIMADAGATAWAAPHTAVDTGAIYAGEVGTYQGITYVETTRCEPFVNAGAGGTVEVFPTYFFGRQAIAEVSCIEPHVVIGPQVDSLRRFFPLGWHALMGWGLYRPEALLRVETASSLNAVIPWTA